MWSRTWVLLPALLLCSSTLADESLQVDAQARVRVESRDNRDFNSAADDQRTNVMTRARLGVSYQPGDGWTFRLLAQDSQAWDPVTSTMANEAEFELQELYAQYKGGPLGVQFGRIPLAYGKQRLVGTFEWSNVARRFDGLKLSYDLGLAQLDGWVTELGGSPSTFAANGEFCGLYATLPKWLGQRTEGYLFWNHDPSSPLANFWTIGARREAKHGPWRYEAEAAGQVGDVTAYAASLEGGRSLGPVDLTLGFATASGDSTPGAGEVTTFQNLFPTNHLHYGMLDYQGWRNVHDLYGKSSWKPNKWLGIEGQAHAFWLANSRDFWYGAGGGPNRTTGGVAYQDPTGAAGTEVGQELDLVVTVNPHPQVSLQAGYGHFFSGGFISRVNAANGVSASDSGFFYFQALGKY